MRITNILAYLAEVESSSRAADDLGEDLLNLGDDLAIHGIRSIDDAQDALTFITETSDLGHTQQILVEKLALYLRSH